MKRDALLNSHLESISWMVLRDHPSIIRGLIHRQHGVYALYKRGKLQYVGLASNLRNRLNTHLRDRHKGTWDRFSVYLTVKSEHTSELESLLLRIFNPTGNRVGGRRFPKGSDLSRTLKRQLQDADMERIASYMGGETAKRLRTNRARRLNGAAALSGYAERRQEIRGTYKGTAIKGFLRRDGKILLKGKLYESPTAAAKSITKRTVSGWAFWHIKNPKGAWIRLRAIRK